MLSHIKQDILRHKIHGRLMSYHPCVPVATVSEATEAIVREFKGRTDISFNDMVTLGVREAQKRMGVASAKA